MGLVIISITGFKKKNDPLFPNGQDHKNLQWMCRLGVEI
jgi:hypothetical protein